MKFIKSFRKKDLTSEEKDTILDMFTIYIENMKVKYPFKNLTGNTDIQLKYVNSYKINDFDSFIVISISNPDIDGIMEMVSSLTKRLTKFGFKISPKFNTWKTSVVIDGRYGDEEYVVSTSDILIKKL